MTPAEWVAIALFLVGGVFGFLVNYVQFTNEFNFIKGQLSQILEIHQDITDLTEKHVKLEYGMAKVIKDVDKAHTKIKYLEQKIFGGLS